MAAPRKYDYSPDRLLEEAPNHPTLRSLALALGIEASAFIHHLRARPALDAQVRDALTGPTNTAAPARQSVTLAGDDASFEVDVVQMGDADKMMRDHGFDPDQWFLRNISATRWGRDPETGEPYKRLKIDLRRKTTITALAHPVPHKPVMPPKAKRSKGTRLGFLFSDFHTPFHDPKAVAAFLNLLRDVQPQFGVFAGDVADVPAPSRHRRNPAWHCAPKESFGSAFRDVLYPTRVILPDAEIDVLTGNHDATRIRNWLLEREPDLLDLCDPSDPDEVPFFSPRKLMGLDGLHMRAIDPHGEYADGKVILCRDLAVIHGEATGKDPGAANLDQYGHDVVFGHTHRKTLTYATRRDFDGYRVHRALGLGCMCLIEGGLGYYRGAESKWQQGGAMVQLYADGTFDLEHVDFIDGTLRWRGERWKA